MLSLELLTDLKHRTRLRQEVRVKIGNASDFAWTSSPDLGGINLSWWWDPKSSDSFSFPIDYPETTGKHVLNIDLVNEHNYWFRQITGSHFRAVVDVDRAGATPWAEFQEICCKLSAFLPRRYPAVDSNSWKKTLLVETRRLDHLGFVIRNTIQKMGEGWGHVIACSSENRRQIVEICRHIDDGIEIVVLERGIASDNDYNNLCLGADIWRRLNCRKVLVYQADTIIMRPFDDRFLEYDYIGASWAPGPHLDNIRRTYRIEDELLHGNGGLSLRSVDLMLQALRDNVFRERFLDVALGDRLERVPEDLYFALYACRHGRYPMVSREFSIEPSAGHKESLDDDDAPFGYHKVYNFPDYRRHLCRSFAIRDDDSLRARLVNLAAFDEDDYVVRRGPGDGRRVDISVIVTLYNYEEYIDRCLRSVLRQTCGSVEIVVVNDNSGDGSLDIARTYLDGELPVTLIDKRLNTGVMHSRNLGISHARGDYVFILDADDELQDRCLERHLESMSATGCVAAYAIIDCHDAQGRCVDTVSDRAYDFDALLVENYIGAMALFNRRELLRLGMYDTGLLRHGPGYEDWDLWLRIGQQGGRVLFIDERLSRYRVKPDGLAAFTSQMFHAETAAYLRKKYGR